MNRNPQDQSVYTDDELREDKAALQRGIEALEQEMDELEAEHRTFIEKGAEASESEMRQFARRAEVTKKKYKIKSRSCDEKRRELAAVQLAKTVRELQSRAGRETTWVPDLVDEIPDAVVEETEIDLNEFAFEWGLEMKMLEEADETLDTGLLQVISITSGYRAVGSDGDSQPAGYPKDALQGGLPDTDEGQFEELTSLSENPDKGEEPWD